LRFDFSIETKIRSSLRPYSDVRAVMWPIKWPRGIEVLSLDSLLILFLVAQSGCFETMIEYFLNKKSHFIKIGTFFMVMDEKFRSLHKILWVQKWSRNIYNVYNCFQTNTFNSIASLMVVYETILIWPFSSNISQYVIRFVWALIINFSTKHIAFLLFGKKFIHTCLMACRDFTRR
jgi:hypothetical protein